MSRLHDDSGKSDKGLKISNNLTGLMVLWYTLDQVVAGTNPWASTGKKETKNPGVVARRPEAEIKKTVTGELRWGQRP